MRWHIPSMIVASIVTVSVSLPGPAGAADVSTETEWLERPGDVRLQQLRTRPAGVEGPLPTVLLVQWVSCSSVVVDREDPNGWDRMLMGLIDDSGWQVIRTEKRGVGESTGDCATMDYETELDDHRAALARLREDPRVDQGQVVIYGASMGATMAPILAAEQARAGTPVAGVMSWGGGAATWFERQLAFDRHALNLSGTPAADLNPQMAEHEKFQSLYLLDRVTPAEIVAHHPELADVPARVRGMGDSDHYGRPYAYHWQAQDQNWPAAWTAIEAPALVMFGEYDWFETREGAQLAVHAANQARPETARYFELPQTDHHFVRFDSAEAAFADEGGNVNAQPVVDQMLRFLAGLIDN